MKLKQLLWNRIQSNATTFFETSTIHGLVHISSSNNILIKFIWTIIVIACFMTAGILIKGAFNSWDESPVASSVETFPVEDLNFPEVTICPPLGSNTALNYDLVQAANATLDKQARDELIDAAHNFLIGVCVDENIKYVTEEDIRNTYKGMRNQDLIKYDWCGDFCGTILTYKVKETGYKGMIQTPRFGMSYDPEKYKIQIEYNFDIVIQKHWKGNITLVMDLQQDLIEVEQGSGFWGYDQIEIEELENPDKPIYNSERLPGVRNETLTYEHMENRETTIRIYYRRQVAQNEMDNWKTRRETGYRMNWWIEGIQNVTSMPLFTEENEFFKSWMNTFYHLTVVDEWKTELLIHTVMELAKNIILSNQNNITGQIVDSLRNFASNSIENDLLEGTVTDLNWKVGFKIFMKILCAAEKAANKRDKINKDMDRIERFYITLLKEASPFTIVHIVSVIISQNNDINTEELKITPLSRDLFTRTSFEVYRKLKQKLNLQLGIIDLSLSHKSDLMNRINQPQFTDMKKIIKSCLYNSSCDQVEDIIKSVKDSKEMIEISTHPVHLVSEDGRMNPSALIPFCQFNGRSIGTKMPQFSSPVCTGFKTRFLEGQKCYSLNLQNTWKKKVKKGRKYGFTLFIDYNLELSVGEYYKQTENKKTLENTNPNGMGIIAEGAPVFEGFEDSSKSIIKKSIKPYINTLENYEAYGGGIHIMSSIKEISTTSGFNEMNKQNRNCQLGKSYEKCLNEKLVENAAGVCGCFPIWLSGLEDKNYYNKEKVSY